MRAFRTDWLVRSTVVSMAIVAALFLAHLGAHDHADECHACEIAAHAMAIDTPVTMLDAPASSALAESPGEPDAIASRAHSSCAPRAPPIS